MSAYNAHRITPLVLWLECPLRSRLAWVQILSRVIPKTLKTVFIAFVLGVLHEKHSVREMSACSFVVSFGTALKGVSSTLYERQIVKSISLRSRRIIQTKRDANKA